MSQSELDFADRLRREKLDATPRSLRTLQLNITRLCNQACRHCHVDSSPLRREMASDAVLARILELASTLPEVEMVDITGGAPELHPQFEEFVRGLRERGIKVMVRHNLTVSLDPHPMTKASMEHLPEFFRDMEVEVVSSLPYYQEYFTDKQRGGGVFQKSIAALQKLNSLGYGDEGSGLELSLVYNPVGSFLPAPQAELERDYKRELGDRFDIRFTRLFAITNIPVNRFRQDLERRGHYESYMEKLWDAFNPEAVDGLMCRDMVSIDHEGRVYDCDFNQMLDLRIADDEGPMDIFRLDPTAFLKRDIAFASHCFGCTAGAGSSCGGTTA